MEKTATENHCIFQTLPKCELDRGGLVKKKINVIYITAVDMEDLNLCKVLNFSCNS